MRIALMATGPVGRAVARLLREHNATVACLILDGAEDKAAKQLIREELPFLNPNDVSDHASFSQDQLAERLRALEIDLVILAWWPYILGPSLLDAPKLGCLNFHPSLLPHNRGKHPNFWALVEQAPYGVTIHFASNRVDGGDLAFQAPLTVTWEDTGGSLYYRAQEEIVRLFERHLPQILQGDIPRERQRPGPGSFHRASELEPASRIELDSSYQARDLLNLLRARTFPPHPGAWFEDGGRRYDVRVEIREVDRRES